ncbi:hypothetical protein P7C73_g1033, partial [Tremellales sp. Uapishka_1]
MPDDSTLLAQLEEWLEAQVPTNLHDLPYRMLETMERVSNELFETLNVHGPPSISIPFPPFMGKETPAPPPPPLPLHSAMYDRADRVVKAHPYFAATGTVVALTVGLGIGTALMGYRFGPRFNLQKKVGNAGVVEDGMLKEAIVILSPSPMPALLAPLTATLLKAGYIVLVSVPQVKDAEQLERRLSGLEQKSALRVLIYDPDDTTTFPPFHRSLLATLTLRFPAIGQNAADQYNPQPTHIPHIHAFVSLYPLHPSPPSQPSALPALPTLLAPSGGRVPSLITLYPAASVLPTPDTFASQLLTTNHLLLGNNLAASHVRRVVSLYIGDLELPTLPALISPTISRRQLARDQLRSADSAQKVSIIKDYLFGTLSSVWSTITGRRAREYPVFEKKILSILRESHGHRYSLGQNSYLPLILARLPVNWFASLSPRLHLHLQPAIQGLGQESKTASPARTRTTSLATSAESSDHEIGEGEGEGEDLGSSIHTSSEEGSGSGTGLGDSWVGLDGN